MWPSWSPKETQSRSNSEAWSMASADQRVLGAAVDRPGELRDLAADQRLGRRIAGADGDVGVAPRQVERLVGDDDVEPDVGVRRPERLEDRDQQVQEERVGGGDAHLAGRRDLAPGDAPAEGADVLVDARGERRHLLARRRRDIAGLAALEERQAHRLLDLAEAAEHRGVVDRQRHRRAGEAAGLRDGLDQAEIIPGQAVHAGLVNLHRCKLKLPSYRFSCNTRKRCSRHQPIHGRPP